MDATPQTVRNLFGADECLIVPIFQRPYVWTRENNWEPLWDDVMSMYTLFQGEDDANPHFMGAVVLDHMRIAKGAMPSRQVVDGQQRLTTLQVLLCAVRDGLTAREQPARFRRALTQLSRNQDEMSGERHANYKVWPTLSDRAIFADIIDAESVDAIDELLSRARETSTLLDAYRYFYEQTLAWFDSLEQNDVEREIGYLLAVLRDGLQLVVINLGENDNAQVIFESLNDRGTPLLPSDLIKNFVFQLLESHAYDAEQMHASYWRDLETPFWKKEIRQGRLQRSRLDAFFSHYLTMRLGKEVLAPSLFTQFREMAGLLDKDGLGTLVADIARYAAVYERISQASVDDDEGRFYAIVAALDTSVLTPVLMYLAAETDVETRNDAQSMLESWLIRRHICKLTSKNYNRLMLDLLQKIKKSSEAADDVIREFLLAQSADSAFWPDDERVQDLLLTGPLYRSLTRARLHIVLVGCERTLRGDPGSLSYSAGQRLSLEKLVTTGSMAWDTVEGDAPASLLDSLGNVTLAATKFDNATANGPWFRKRERLMRDNTIAMNHSLPTQFGHEEILARGLMLADAFCASWSHPSSQANTPDPIATVARPTNPVPDQAIPPSIPVEPADESVAPQKPSQLMEPIVAPSGSRPNPAMMPVFSSATAPATIVSISSADMSHLRWMIQKVFDELPIGTLLTLEELRARLSKKMDVKRIDLPTIREAISGHPPQGVESIDDPELLLEKVYQGAGHSADQTQNEKRSRQSYDPDVLALIERGYIIPGDHLVFHQKRAGKYYHAQIRRDGTITVGNETFTAVSTALSFCLNYPINGWQNWKLQRTGELIHELRMRILGEGI